MALICDPCHRARFGTSIHDTHLAKSFGSCEVCRVTHECADCQNCTVPTDRIPQRDKARESAAKVVDQFLVPVMSITERVIRDEFPDLDRADVRRAMVRIRDIIVTGNDAKTMPPDALTRLPQMDFPAMTAAIEGRLDLDENGQPT